MSKKDKNIFEVARKLTIIVRGGFVRANRKEKYEAAFCPGFAGAPARLCASRHFSEHSPDRPSQYAIFPTPHRFGRNRTLHLYPGFRFAPVWLSGFRARR